MIRRFFADGLHWVVIAGAILGAAIYVLYAIEPAASAVVIQR